MPGTCPYLGGSEAEGGGVCVRALSVLEHQPPVLRQRQVVTRGQVSQAERLTPADVAAAPADRVAAKKKKKSQNKTHRLIKNRTKVVLHNPFGSNSAN